jgi:membrane protein implicated in regulation of membrane protease activity
MTEVRESAVARALRSFFETGVSVGLLNFTRVVIVLILCSFVIWPFIDYNIHFVFMAILSFFFFLLFEYLVYHLKRNPDVMRGNRPKTEENTPAIPFFLTPCHLRWFHRQLRII